LVYVKYIKRGGKKYGPYYYQSIRDKNGNIKNLYVGKVKKKKNIKKIDYTLLIFFTILSLVTLLFIGDNYTGFVTLQKNNGIINSNTEIIDNLDGTQTAVIYSVPIFSKENNFKDVENKIKKENLNEYSIDNGLYQAFFSNNIKNGVKFVAYENYLNYKPTNVYIDNEVLNVNNINGVVNNLKVNYNNVFDNIDLEYEVQLKQLKESFIIKNPIQVHDFLIIEGIVEIPDWQNIIAYDA